MSREYPSSALDLDTHPFLLNCLNGTLDLENRRCFSLMILIF